MKKPNVLPALLAAAVSLAPTFAVGTTAPPTKGQVTQALFGLAVPFEENKGQVDSKVAFQARTVAGPLFVTKTGELVWSLTSAANAPVCTVVERFEGGQLSPAGAMPAVTRVSYLLGNDPAKWQRNVKTWQQVSLGQVWPGISVSLAAHGNNAEKIFTLAPGADVNTIAVAVAGGSLQLEANGNLRVSSADKPLVSFSTPIAWQEINGQRQPVQVAYRLADADKYGFTLGAYDAKHAVVIDPVVQSTYIGGTGTATAGGVDQVNAIVATSFGIYVAGTTTTATTLPTEDPAVLSSNFPGMTRDVTATTDVNEGSYAYANAYDVDMDGKLDVKEDVDEDGNLDVKEDVDGDGRLDSVDEDTNDNGVLDAGEDVNVDGNLDVKEDVDGDGRLDVKEDVDGDGHLDVLETVTKDAFVARLTPDLKTILQATYFGASGDDEALAMVVTANDVYVAGVTGAVYTNTGTEQAPVITTTTTNLPNVTNGVQAARSAPAAAGTVTDAFVTVLGLELTLPVGTSDLQSTYFGGTGNESAKALAVNNNAVFIAGETTSTSNTTPGFDIDTDATGADTDTDGVSIQQANGGSTDAFIAKLPVTLTGTGTIATYFGGSGVDTANAMALTSTAVYIAGITAGGLSTTTTGAAQPALATGDTGGDAYVARFGLTLLATDSIKQATYLGGTGVDVANALAVSSSVYVAGSTTSTTFPFTTGGMDTTGDASGDAFVTRLNSDLKFNSAVQQSTFLGHISGADTANALALTSTAIYVAGDTASTTSTLPLVAGGAQPANAGTTEPKDGFVARLGLNLKSSDSIKQTTYLGGPAADSAKAIAIATNGSVYVAGKTQSIVTAEATVTTANAPSATATAATVGFPSIAGGGDATADAANGDGFVTLFTSDLRASLPTVETTAVTNNTTAGAVLKGNVTPQGADTTVTFDLGTDTNYDLGPITTGVANGTVLAMVGKTPVAVAVTAPGGNALVCGTTYHYRVVAENSLGISKGTDKTFVMPCAPTLTITAPTAAPDLGINQAVLKGSVDPNGAVTLTVSFVFGDDEPTYTGNGTSTPYAPPASCTAPNSLSNGCYDSSIAAIPPTVTGSGAVNVDATKTGLTCRKKYYFRVKAVAGGGTPTYSEEAEFTTSPCDRATVKTDAATTITKNSVRLLGSVVDYGGAATTVKFQFSPTGVYTDAVGTTPATYTEIAAVPAEVNSAGTKSVYADRALLACYTRYHYRVKATNSIGTTYGSSLFFNTLGCPFT